MILQLLVRLLHQQSVFFQKGGLTHNGSFDFSLLEDVQEILPPCVTLLERQVVLFALRAVRDSGEMHVHAAECGGAQVLLVQIEHLVPFLRGVDGSVVASMQVSGIDDGVDVELFADLEHFFQCAELRLLPHGLQPQVHAREMLGLVRHDVVHGTPDIVVCLCGIHTQIKRGVDAHGLDARDLRHAEGSQNALLAGGKRLFVGRV